jgi:hypothetical protein
LKRQKNQKMIYRLQKERMVGQRRSYFALILLYLRAPCYLDQLSLNAIFLARYQIFYLNWRNYNKTLLFQYQYYHDLIYQINALNKHWSPTSPTQVFLRFSIFQIRALTKSPNLLLLRFACRLLKKSMNVYF